MLMCLYQLKLVESVKVNLYRRDEALWIIDEEAKEIVSYAMDTAHELVINDYSHILSPQQMSTPVSDTSSSVPPTVKKCAFSF